MQFKTRSPSWITLAFVAAVLAAPVGAGHAKDDPVEPAAAARLAALTNQLIAGIGEYHRAAAAQRAAAASKLKAVARERRTLLLATLERAPGLTLRRTLPAGLTMGLPAEVRDLLEREVQITGRITNLHSDDLARGVCSDKYFLELDSAPVPVSLRLHAADVPDRPGLVHPAAQFAGKKATVRAMRMDNQLLIADAGAIEASGDSPAPAAGTMSAAAISGAQSTLVLTANFQDKALSCTTGTVDSIVFGTANSVNDLYRQTSNGEVAFAGATYGPFTIPFSSTTCDYAAWGTELERIATAQGINLSQYTRRVYVFPSNACSAAGYGTYGGTTTGAWIFHCGIKDLYAHELGHNLSFRHATTPGDTYGDVSDVMGISGAALRQLNAPNKVRAGWIPSTHARQVTGPGTFTLSPTAAVAPPNPQALVLAKPDTSDNYYISLRQPVGYDANLDIAYRNRISIHRASTTAMPTTLLTTLSAGQSYSDSVNGYTFTVDTIGTDSASVSVAMATPTCVRAAPSVTVSPVSQSGAPGKAIGYNVTVTSNNNGSCGTSTYAFTPSLPGGWGSSNSPATLALGAGGSASTVWTVTSPTSGVAEQSYTVGLSAYDAAATTSAATVQANYLVTVADSTLPTVGITSPASGASVSGNVTVTANAADNIGVAKVEFSVNGALVATDTAAPYSFNWNTRKLSGSYTLTAVAVDAAGNRSAPSSITVTATGGGKRR